VNLARVTLIRYAIAPLSVSLVLLLKLWQDPLLGRNTPFLAFVAAIMVTSWYGGFGPGALATLLSGLASDYFFIPPLGGLLASFADMARLGVFMLEGLLISALCSALRRSRSEVLARVQARTAELAEANESLRAEIDERRRAQEALQKSETRYRRLIETANEGIWLLGPDVKVTYVNARLAEMLGYARSEMLGRSALDFLYEEDHADYRQRLHRRREGISDHYDSRLRRKDGSDLWVLVSGNPMVGEDGGFSGVLAVFTDLSERRRAEEALRLSAGRLQTLSQSLMQAQEGERRFIARELHDEVGQTLTALKINLQTSLRSSDTSALAARLDDSIALVERMLEQVRSLSLELRPPLLDDVGLPGALEWYVNRQAERAGFTVHFSADSTTGRLPWELETACFRVVQEALTNVVRHADARCVRVELRQSDDRLHVSIRDDGVGFDVDAARHSAASGDNLGLISMSERVLLAGGDIDIRSAPEAGTQILASFPIADRD
jgi:PAS domain S-box-containing protein